MKGLILIRSMYNVYIFIKLLNSMSWYFVSVSYCSGQYTRMRVLYRIIGELPSL